MRTKRRRHILRNALLCLLCLLLLAAAGTGVWLLLRPRAMDKNQPSAVPPQGAVYGLHITQGYPTTAGGLSASGPKTLDALFDEAVAYAASHGMNAVLLDIAGDRLSGCLLYTSDAADD